MQLNKDLRANDNFLYHDTLHYLSGFDEEIPNHNRRAGSPDGFRIEYLSNTILMFYPYTLLTDF
jgi:hypothetical protein